MPSWSQIEAQLRILLTAVASMTVTLGWTSEETATSLAGVIMLVLGIVWSMYVNREAALVQFAEAVPSVKRIEVSTDAAGVNINNQTGIKVVGERTKK